MADLNLENLRLLKAFFDAGAPHYHFDMTLPYGDPKSPEVREYVNTVMPNECGSAGCIAGAAYQLFSEDPILFTHVRVQNWQEVGSTALKLLGLTEDYATDGYFHELFDPELAPKGCTPAQASKAISRVMKGKKPWKK